jgi:hypothetical protein
MTSSSVLYELGFIDWIRWGFSCCGDFPYHSEDSAPILDDVE